MQSVFRNRYLGSLGLLGLCILVEVLRTTEFNIPNPPSLLLLGIVYSAFVGGFTPGLISAFIGCLYIAYFFSIPSEPFHYTDENFRRVCVWTITVPLISVMVGVLKRRSVQAVILQLQEKERAGEVLNHLYRELEDRVKERTKDLMQVETELRLITNALPVGITYVDRELRFKFCNDTFCRWSEKTKEQIIGSRVEDILGPVNYEIFLPYLDKSLLGQQIFAELPLDNAHKSKTIALTSVPDFSEDGSIRGIVCLANDVTTQKQIELQLKLAKESSEAANDAKSAFLANVSHEIRTPLGAVLGFSELLALGNPSPSERKSYIQIIKRNGALLSRVINDVLDFSKIEADKLQIEKREFSLIEALSDLTSMLKLQAEENSTQLKISIDREVPAIIETDQIRLRQILLNVIGNAIKFTNRGLVEVSIKLLETDAGLRLGFIVKDTGIGISPEEASKLFHPFAQADDSNVRKFGGTGLGLALAKKLARLLGGDVELRESKVGKGSLFIVTIDPGFHTEKMVHSASAERSPSPSLGVVRLDGVRVLLVEDSPDNQLLVTQILQFSGATVETAENGREGVLKAEGNNYDILLMDLQMPVMDGYEATAKLRNSGYKKPIIALTAHALREVRELCLKGGFDDHLMKPMDRLQMINCIARFSGRKNDQPDKPNPGATIGLALESYTRNIDSVFREKPEINLDCL